MEWNLRIATNRCSLVVHIKIECEKYKITEVQMAVPVKVSMTCFFCLPSGRAKFRSQTCIDVNLFSDLRFSVHAADSLQFDTSNNQDVV